MRRQRINRGLRQARGFGHTGLHLLTLGDVKDDHDHRLRLTVHHLVRFVGDGVKAVHPTHRLEQFKGHLFPGKGALQAGLDLLFIQPTQYIGHPQTGDVSCRQTQHLAIRRVGVNITMLAIDHHQTDLRIFRHEPQTLFTRPQRLLGQSQLFRLPQPLMDDAEKNPHAHKDHDGNQRHGWFQGKGKARGNKAIPGQ